MSELQEKKVEYENIKMREKNKKKQRKKIANIHRKKS